MTIGSIIKILRVLNLVAKKKRVTAGEETEETISVPGERKATERNDI